MLLFY